MIPDISGITKISEVSFKNGKLLLTATLAGLEDRPIHIEAAEIHVPDDGSSIKIGKFRSDMPFVDNALNRFAMEAFNVPEGDARAVLVEVAKILNL